MCSELYAPLSSGKYPPLDCGPQRRIAVVGNAPPTYSMAKEIDSADFVIRFNNPQAFGAEYGERIDLLCLVNSGGQAREWLHDRTLTQTGYFLQSQAVLFPNDPSILDQYHPKSLRSAQGVAISHLTEELRDWVEAAGKPVEIATRALYLQTFYSLGLSCSDLTRYWLSSGILATAYALASCGKHSQLEIYGFSWQGWDGHPWAWERAWYAAAQRKAALRLAT